MKKTRFLKALLLVCVFLVNLPSLSMASVSDPVGTANVTREEADTVAALFLERHQFSEPFSSLISVEPVYNINEILLGYYYKFDKQYVLVSANKSYSPVLAAGKGSLEITELSNGERLYYMGGIEAVYASNSQNVILGDRENGQKVSAQSPLLLSTNPNAASAWDAYLNGSATAIGIRALSERKLTIETFDQYASGVNHSNSACGPTTMAAISEYWRTNGFGLLPSTTYYGSKAATINHFYSEHGGTIVGMSVAGVKNGLVAHNGDFYRSATASTITTGYATYRSEINAGRPVAVKFDTKFTFFEPDRDYAYDYHWTVGKGYAYDNFDSMIIINDNTGTSQEHYIDFPTNQPILSLVSFSM